MWRRLKESGRVSCIIRDIRLADDDDDDDDDDASLKKGSRMSNLTFLAQGSCSRKLAIFMRHGAYLSSSNDVTIALRYLRYFVIVNSEGKN